MQEPNQNVRDLTWQLELLVIIRPEEVGSVLVELEMPIDLSGEPAAGAKAIVEFFSASAFSGMTKFLASLCKDLSIGKLNPVVGVIIKSWLSLLSSFCDDDLFAIAEEDTYYSQSLSSQNEIFSIAASGVREGFIQQFSPLALHKCGLSRVEDPTYPVHFVCETTPPIHLGETEAPYP